MAKSSSHKKHTTESIVENASLETKISSFTVNTFNFDKWFPLIIAAFALLLYINTINHDYVLDDDTVMAKNSIVTKGVSAIPEILTTAYRKGAWARQESLYRPLSLVMFAIEWQLAPNQPFLGHLLNIILYALTGFLLYKLLRKWFQQKHAVIAYSIALLFIAHPLHTEVVANIKSRDEILGLLFSILSLSAFYNYAISDKKTRKLIFGVGYFFLALLSKESTLTLVAVIPLSIYFFTENTDKKKYYFSIIALFIGVLFYFILRKIALGGLVNFKEVEVMNNSIVATNNTLDRTCTAIMIVGYYIKLFFFPHPLSFDYSFNTIPNATLSDYRFILTIITLVALAIYCIKNFKNKNGIAFGFLFFGITLSIVSNIFILIEATLAERFLFLPSLGLSIASVLLLEKLSKISISGNPTIINILKQNKIFSSILMLILLLFSLKTISRNEDWKDNFTLFSIDKDHNPNSYRTLAAYPLELFNHSILPLKEDTEEKKALCREAIEYLQKSVTLIPNNFRAWNLMAYCYSINLDYANVISTFEKGIQYYKDEPDLAKFHIMAATAYFKTSNIYKAIDVAKAGLKIEPNNSALWNTLGSCLLETTDRQGAYDALQNAIRLDSLNVDAFYNLGNWYAKGGNYSEAINYYQKTLKDNSNFIPALNNLANCYAVTQQYEKAISIFEKILSIEPNNIDAIRNLSVTYANTGNTIKAKELTDRLQLLH